MHSDEIVAITVYYVKTPHGHEHPQVVRNWTSVAAARAYKRAMARAGKKTVRLTECHHA